MRKCQVCDKGSMIQQSGAHQYGGGWAMRATKKRAVWMPNLHSAKVTYKGVRRTMRLCTKCLRRVKEAMPKRVAGEEKQTKPLIVPKVKEPALVATA
ncbi:MAG: L28 family ribosomal protein [Candidatus Curtissbacteria bacterium]|nr:L28 family ribosomal protein [Candidatus Curtissbacteria bacterium]